MSDTQTADTLPFLSGTLFGFTVALARRRSWRGGDAPVKITYP